LLAKISTSYSKYFNKKYERVGHTFQDAFKAVLVVSDAQLLWLSAYIHQNPNVGGLVTKLSDYPWSSYLDYAGTRNGTLVDKSFLLQMFGGSIKNYEKFVLESFSKIYERKDLEHLLLD
jgi:GT2 family glycosyltransferase